MPASVRRAVPADAASLAAVARVTFPLACPPHTTEAAIASFIATVLSEERFADYLVDQHRIVLVAEDDAGATVGYSMLVLGEPTDEDVRAAIRTRPTVELSKCYVLPGHHGAGVASTLMSETLREASLTGAAAVWLGVNQLNARAQRFYGKHGFERVGAKRFLVGDRFEDDWVMERSLSPRRP
ncbi:GNAT family N-acetyltransferase [Leifsonia sp. AG29]|uniref:GNAT family N-acetyltransferase n=1 Tax=Leifsonia sp. AG29 TaxID=2598860 RepID=UPI00131CC4E1|nr:GNAT family N-acetyltransferase [Leifsonia sp. AG29]